jgi:hypothetical protein
MVQNEFHEKIGCYSLELAGLNVDSGTAQKYDHSTFKYIVIDSVVIGDENEWIIKYLNFSTPSIMLWLYCSLV